LKAYTVLLLVSKRFWN